MTVRAIDQLPANMQSKIAIELCPVAGLDGFCWAWQNCLTSKGYGCVQHQGRRHLTHRVAYMTLVGPIPDSLQIDHLCTNKRCCNPSHLEPVTGKVNAARSWPALKTQCVHGHRLIGHNLLTKKRGARSPVRNCRTCANDQHRAARRANAFKVAREVAA